MAVKDDAQVPAKRKQKRPNGPRRGGRAAGADQSEEAKTERYVNSTAVGEHHANAINAKARSNRLKALIEPNTEAMVKVMIDIAKDEKIHASIRLEAADRVLSRAYGKPKEHIEIEDAGSEAREVDEVTALLNNVLKSIGAPTLDDSGSEPK